MSSEVHKRAWEDWGAVDPMYAILTDPRYHGRAGDLEEFLAGGAAMVNLMLSQIGGLGLSPGRDGALDFGCGIGRLTGALSDHFAEVIGLDVSSTMISQARELHADRTNCTFELHASDDLRRFADSTFDLAVCLLVLQHLSSTAEMVVYLQELVRVLKPNGVLVVQLHSAVPAPPPRAPWTTRKGLGARVGPSLRRLGVSPRFLYERLGWTPEMTMLPIADADVREALESAGGLVVYATEPEGDFSRIYYVAR